ncbi:tol-pal system-associated acyl-CoA thioesterase [Siculibacillus lacustris]|uniref:Tol-pal system-associated acyl-CoA thioesterase n=1 Tax=Siculibacillus lacustris TaxID=1549641 RepID=A0A4Q9VKL3_9HYPH|nr:tol-pal system-associated acyl-CoA thioesterase [Siculibacillus lacustris]TBW35937.1 tol-pal system-associated acyl-CoA thioesterase [Siculibacillus lacustris]
MTATLPVSDRPDHRLAVRVYYEDTDAGGIVYHASHVRFFERGRTEYLRALGISQSAMKASEHPLLFAVRRLEIDYLKTAGLDDLLEVATTTREVGGARMILDQVLRRGDEVIATAVVTVVAVGPDGRPHRVPADLRHRFGHPE